MKYLYFVIFLIFTSNCSFDNKSGIWNNENLFEKEDNKFEEFKTLTSSNRSFNKIVNLDKNFKFKLTNPVNNFEWNEIFYNDSNNTKNFKYTELNKINLKSKKLTKYKINKFLLFEENNLILNDEKGNIIIFSISSNRIIAKFNFYKKKLKKIEKNLNFIVEKNIIYVADNIGYLYAYNYKKDKLMWAKNYKIPFRSNLKISSSQLIVANQNNNLYFFNKNNGEIIRSIPTEETIIKNRFTNNLSLNDNFLFFLNTYGSLYAINLKSLKISWFVNLNQSLDINPSNLFFSNQIINNDSKIVISTNQFTYIIDANNGSIIHKKEFSSLIKPILVDNYIFLVTKKSLLIALNLINGKIIYSFNINNKISEYLNTKKKEVEFKNISFLNNKIFVILKNSYSLKFDVYGTLEEIKKLPSKIKTQPIFINSSIMYLDFKNRLSIIN